MVRPGIDLFSRFDLEISGGRISAMEGLRAYAVLLTFSVHFFGAWLLQFGGIDTGAIAPSDLTHNTDRVFAWLQLSAYGVYLFFILSGFLICRLVGNAARFSYPRFLWRRFCRIYPAFLLALVLGVAVFSFYAGWAPFSWRVPWGIAVAGAALVYIPFALGWGQALYLLIFAGATAARFDDARLSAFARRMPEAAVLVLHLCVTTAIAFKVVSDHVAIWLYAIAGTLLVIQACYGTGWLSRLFSWRPLRRIGNVSYSLFLVHTIPILFVVYVLGPRWFSATGLLPALSAAVIALAGALILAGVLFLVAKKPYFAARRRKLA